MECHERVIYHPQYVTGIPPQRLYFGSQNQLKTFEMGSATPQQMETLLNFLDEHRDLARGQLRSIEGKVQSKRLWDEICNTLNSMGGCTKTVQQWQKVWADRKYAVKKAAAASRSSASATGGGPSTAPQLSEWELKVLSIMGQEFGQSQTSASVPAFVEPSEQLPSTSSSQTVPQPLRLDLLEVVVEPNQPTQLLELESQPIPAAEPPQESRTSRRSLSAQTRRRRSAVDVRSRLYEIEENRADREQIRNAELAGIKAALLQLCGLIKEYLDKI